MQMNQSQQPMNTREGETRERLCYTVEELMEILGVGRTKMMERLNSGFYPFAFKDQSGRWKMNQADLYRFQNQGI